MRARGKQSWCDTDFAMSTLESAPYAATPVGMSDKRWKIRSFDQPLHGRGQPSSTSLRALLMEVREENGHSPVQHHDMGMAHLANRQWMFMQLFN